MHMYYRTHVVTKYNQTLSWKCFAICEAKHMGQVCTLSVFCFDNKVTSATAHVKPFCQQEEAASKAACIPCIKHEVCIIHGNSYEYDTVLCSW